MRSIVFLGLMALVCGVRCRDSRGENSPRQLRLLPKDKRGLGDHSVTFPSHGSSYSTPIHSGLGASYGLAGSSSGFSLGQAGYHGLSSPISHGIGYSFAPSSGLNFGSGYLGSLGLQGASLGGQLAQSTYSVPSIASIGLGGGAASNGLFSPSKTGPVTFGLHGGSGGGASSAHSAPIYTSGSQGPAAYSGSVSGLGLPFMLTSPHGSSYSLLGSSGSPASYSLPVQTLPSSSSHTVTGGLIIASGPHAGSSSYSMPISGSSHSGISTLGGSSSSHGSSSAYALPITSGSHGISALSSNSASPSYGASVSSGTYGSSNSHVGLSSGSSDASSYELPISSGSYSSSSASSGPTSSYASYARELPAHSDSSSSYSSNSASGSSSSYSSPSVIYSSPSSSYSASSPADHSTSYSSLSSSYTSPGPNYSSPSVTYTGSASYTPSYSSSSGAYGTAAESHGAYSSVSPKYLGYSSKSYNGADTGGVKYDTISYSSPDGKY